MNEAITDFNEWISREGKDSLSILSFLRIYVKQLHSYDIPVDRIFLGSRFLHAQCATYNWRYETPDTFTVNCTAKKMHLLKLKTLHPGEPFIRMIHEGEDCVVRYKHSDKVLPSGGMTEIFGERGFTDLYGVPFYYRGEFKAGITWATKHPDGFTDDQICFFQTTKFVFGLCMQALLNKLVTHSLLCAYLGADPGQRVHNGSVDRGDGITVRSVIWFSDVRGFTSLSNRLDRDQVIDLINSVFEVTETVLKNHGGEILKFMGDGVLAIFVKSDGQEQGISHEEELYSHKNSLTEGGLSVCCKAREAAAEFQHSLKRLGEERAARGLHGAKVGIGLHYGDCSYGNVGGQSRLDFTVIGPSVNLASRVEGLCSKLGASVLATNEFVRRDPDQSSWTFRGEHALKGVTGATSVYELTVSGQSSTEDGSSSIHPLPKKQSMYSDLMRRCLELAQIAKDHGNVPVGSLVADPNGKIIAEASETLPTVPNVTGHAEVLCIQSACERLNSLDLSGGYMLVTTAEPCWMCSYAIRETGILTVVVGTRTRSVGGISTKYPILVDDTISAWKQPPEVIMGVLEDECRRLREE